MSAPRALRGWASLAALVAAAGALGVLLGDGPYLGFDALSPWIVAWAAGLFALMMLAPSALHRRIAERDDDRDRRWELAILCWGGAALALGALAFAVALASGFDRADPLGALAIVALAEAALIAGGLLALMLTTG